jgi:hypothetical protein
MPTVKLGSEKGTHMPEGNINAEIAERLHENGEHAEGADHESSKRRIEIIEILEAILLAIVAISTALSGYQAALFDGESAKEYATSSRLRVEATNAQLSGNQVLAYNAGNVTAWIQAMVNGDTKLADVLASRFTPDFKPAFDAWVKTDPLHNPDAPAGPSKMPEYKDPLGAKAVQLNDEAAHAFDLGVTTRLTGEDYVRVTVILAAALFLIAIGQRFKIRGVRYSLNSVAGALILYCIYLITSYPHIFTH